jgi:hypothetical protein
MPVALARPIGYAYLLGLGALMAVEKHSITVGSHIISYCLKPTWRMRKTPNSIEEIDRILAELLETNPSLQPRGFIERLYAITDLTIAEAPSVALAGPSTKRYDSLFEEFFDFIKSGASDEEAQQWLVINLPRFDVERRSEILLSFYEQARNKRNGISTKDDMTYEEFKEALKEMEKLFRKKS